LSPSRTPDSGVLYGAIAYVIWGLLAVYWTMLERVPATQVIAHRVVWSFVALVLLLAVMRLGNPAEGASGRVIGLYAVAGVLIGVNWFMYVWAVNHGLVVQSSLGYFITPLVNVALGVLVLRERLRRWQWVAIAIAATGVVSLAIAYGEIPRIALALSLTFGFYGLVKKQAPLPPLKGLTLETGTIFVPALIYLVVLDRTGEGAFLHTGVGYDALLVAAGPVTILPLLLFAAAVQRVPLSVVGVLQYISPTIQFLLGVFLYREPFSRNQLLGFAIVWVALVVFAVDGILAARRGTPS
jgi:chloramphenicol-sensitive protein RarD